MPEARKNNPIVVERKFKDGDQSGIRHVYWCPGCDELHGIPVFGVAGGWQFTGTLECPTYSPSQLTRGGEHRCHTFIRGGQIQYLDDCTHHLKGKTVDMVPVPDWVCGR